MSYTCSVNYHIHFEEFARMECSALTDAGIILNIGDMTIWPSREQLVAIRDAIQGYLVTHPPITPAEIATAVGIETETDAQEEGWF